MLLVKALRGDMMPLPGVASNQILGWNTGDRTEEEVFTGAIRKPIRLPRQAPTAPFPYSMLRASATAHVARGLERPVLRGLNGAIRQLLQMRSSRKLRA
jgi:hypothetical protein